jgi:hypothetical protein
MLRRYIRRERRKRGRKRKAIREWEWGGVRGENKWMEIRFKLFFSCGMWVKLGTILMFLLVRERIILISLRGRAKLIPGSAKL